MDESTGSLSIKLYLALGIVVVVARYFLQSNPKTKIITRHVGPTIFVDPSCFLSNLLKFDIPLFVLSTPKLWKQGYKDSYFAKFKSDIVQINAFWPRPVATFGVADIKIVKEVTSARHQWQKPVDGFEYSRVSSFGRNLVVIDGEEWRRHRKIINPAFSEANTRFVWSEASRVTLSLIDNVWKNKEVIPVTNALDATVMLALFIIGSAAFGKPISFKDDKEIPKGHSMSFKDAIHIVSVDLTLGFILPGWAKKLTSRMRKFTEAFNNLRAYMEEMIEERRDPGTERPERFDLLSTLLDANEEAGISESAFLSDDELFGNVYMFLLAGHETSANSLCFALGLLALHQDEQEELYQDIVRVLPNNRLPEYEDLKDLKYSLAVIYETLRFFPPAPKLGKRAVEDTVLQTTNEAGESVSVPVAKGSIIDIWIKPILRHPRYWSEPERFMPKRFLGEYCREAFLAFGDGPRACIGRRFAETEMVAMLTILISRYKVEVLEEPQFTGDTFEERKARILDTKYSLTLTPVRVPLVFKKRK